MNFEWDDAKAAINRRKHGVSFEEASSVFNDPNVLLFFDEQHSDSEDRYLAIGMSDKSRVLVVSHTYRGKAIRIISARKATPSEARQYG